MPTTPNQAQDSREQPWKEWLHQELAARRTAEIDQSAMVAQQKLRTEYEKQNAGPKPAGDLKTCNKAG